MKKGMRTKVILLISIAKMSNCHKKKWITTNILLSSYILMYSLESNIPNEYPNIFMRKNKSWMNVRIYLLWKNPRIFRRINIFVNKYLNTFEYPNIRYTLCNYLLVDIVSIIKDCFKSYFQAVCINTRWGSPIDRIPSTAKSTPSVKWQ